MNKVLLGAMNNNKRYNRPFQPQVNVPRTIGILRNEKGIILDIFSLSGKTPDDKDRLIFDSNGSEIRSSVFLIIEIGMLSAPGALPSLKPFVIDLSSSAVT